MHGSLISSLHWSSNHHHYDHDNPPNRSASAWVKKSPLGLTLASLQCSFFKVGHLITSACMGSTLFTQHLGWRSWYKASKSWYCEPISQFITWFKESSSCESRVRSVCPDTLGDIFVIMITYDWPNVQTPWTTFSFVRWLSTIFNNSSPGLLWIASSLEPCKKYVNVYSWWEKNTFGPFFPSSPQSTFVSISFLTILPLVLFFLKVLPHF